MPTLKESDLSFDFDDGWNVVQWDAHPAYTREGGGFQALQTTQACDFIAVRQGDGAYLIEVKNFIGYHAANKLKPRSADWAEEMAGKVRDTLAGIIWTCGRPYDEPPLRPLIRETLQELNANPPRLTVVLWIDDDPALDAVTASSLRTAVQRHLRGWLKIRDVRVLSCKFLADDSSGMPGLKVTQLR